MKNQEIIQSTKPSIPEISKTRPVEQIKPTTSKQKIKLKNTQINIKSIDKNKLLLDSLQKDSIESINKNDDVKILKQYLQQNHIELSISRDLDTGINIYKIHDSKGQLIKEIPSKGVVEAIKKIKENGLGIFVNEVI